MGRFADTLSPILELRQAPAMRFAEKKPEKLDSAFLNINSNVPVNTCHTTVAFR
jgi:hypothetical protein